MNNVYKTIVVNDQVSGYSTTLQVSEDITIGEIQEINNSIANYNNKSSGNVSDLVVSSKIANKFLSVGDSVGKILKGTNFDVLEIRNRFSQTQSELQTIAIKIIIQNYQQQEIQSRALHISRLDKLSQIEDWLLEELKKKREEYPMQFCIKGRFLHPDRTLADLNLIDNDEIKVIVPNRLKIKIGDGENSKQFIQYFNPYNSLKKVSEIIYSQLISQASTDSKIKFYEEQFNNRVTDLQFIIKQIKYLPFYVNLTLADLDLIDNDEILVIVQTKLRITIQDGKNSLQMIIYFNPQDSLKNALETIHIKMKSWASTDQKITFDLKQFENRVTDQNLQFIIKQQQYNPFKDNLTLADLNLIDNDEILVVVYTKLNIIIQDGDSKINMEQFYNTLDTLQAISQQIYEIINLKTNQGMIELEINNQSVNSNHFNKTISDLKLNDNTQIIAKVRYSGGSQRNKNPN